MFYTFSNKTQQSYQKSVPFTRNKTLNTTTSFGSMFDIKGPASCASCPKSSPHVPRGLGRPIKVK